MFGLGALFYAALLFINAVAVLSEDRFLARIGWGSNGHQTSQQQGFYDNYQSTSTEGVKTRLISLITATRTLLRIPLVVVNTVVIVYELVLG